MPSSPSKRRQKQLENEAKRSSRSSPGSRAAKDKHTDSRVETPITLPTTTSALADSLSPPAGGDTVISVHASSKADSSESIDNPADQYTQGNFTPSKSLDKDLREEDGLVQKDTSVTFNSTSLDRGVPAVKPVAAATSVTSDPRPNSRRGKTFKEGDSDRVPDLVEDNDRQAEPVNSNSRRGKARNRPVGRTSESFTRTDQAYIRWENTVYDSLFTDRPNGDSTAIAAFTLASGRHVKIGESLDKPLVDGHIQQLRQDLTFGQKEVILAEFLKPAERSKRTMPNVAPHTSRRRRNTNDDDDRSILTKSTENSISSKQSGIISRYSDELNLPFTTPDPSNRQEPMQSPIRAEDGLFIHRREHVNSAQHANMRPVITTPDFSRQEASQEEDSVTLFDKRRPFIHS